MDDLVQQPRRSRSLYDLQQLAIRGKFGKVAGKLKPFDKILVGQL